MTVISFPEVTVAIRLITSLILPMKKISCYWVKGLLKMISLTRSGEDLVIDLSGSKDQVRVDNWFVSEVFQVEQIHVGNDVLLSSKVDTLISAMAGFDNPAAGNMEISSKIKQQIAPSIVAAWNENVA